MNKNNINITSSKGRKLTGLIDRVVYNNSENGYTVLRLAVRGYPNPVTAVGYLHSPTAGEEILMNGEWQEHPKFGMQFKIDSCETVAPTTETGLEKYLSSGLIRGIGPAFAERIVAKFGKDTLEILDNNPERLIEVEGIGEKKIASIVSSWSEQREIRELILFLQKYGTGSGYAAKVFRQYGPASLLVLKENPYRLAIDIFGIGFYTADKIASNMGFPKDSPLRIRAGVLHLMTKFVGDGYVYVPLEELTEKASEILGVNTDLIELGIEEARLAQEIIIEWFENSEGKEQGAVYLPAFHYAESHSAKKLQELISSPFNGQYVNTEVAIPWVQEELNIEFAGQQIEALKIAVNSQIMVLTGGPGTGKTTLIRAILKIREARGYRVMLAAPTGRAAKRMTEATGHEAKTIHRMLEYVGTEGDSGGFMRNDSNPLECDLLIVDEASMIDQILLYHLLKAVPDGASLIFVGDVNQLPSVGAGNILKDIIDSGICPTVMLSEIFRQAEQSNIVVNAHKINAGEMPLFDKHYESGLKDFYFIEQSDPDKALEVIKTLVTERIPERFQFNPLEDIQVLTPMHKGPIGTVRLNTELQRTLNRTDGVKLQRMGRVFQEGDKVMQVRNNYEKDVYNGDIGAIYRINADEQKLIVKMDNGLVSYDFHELDELIHAYAISIHKSQGSEYPAVVIPILTQHYVMLQRNLLYTAITRGKKLVIIVGTKKALGIAVKNDSTRKRWTRLTARLMKGM